eukprot:560537-Prorocentrum_minimum.AAC.6
MQSSRRLAMRCMWLVRLIYCPSLKLSITTFNKLIRPVGVRAAAHYPPPDPTSRSLSDSPCPPARPPACTGSGVGLL